MTDLPTEPGALVDSLAAAWAAGDLDRIMAHLSDDAIYHNMPMEVVQGQEAIREAIGGFLAMASISFDTHHQVVAANRVMNERTDTFDMGDSGFSVPVMGSFLVEDGKITEWRDYFDMSKFSGSD